jgi:hypothetical protein
MWIDSRHRMYSHVQHNRKMSTKGNFALKHLHIRDCYLYVKDPHFRIWASVVVVPAVAVAIFLEILVSFIADTLNVDVQLW